MKAAEFHRSPRISSKEMTRIAKERLGGEVELVNSTFEPFKDAVVRTYRLRAKVSA